MSIAELIDIALKRGAREVPPRAGRKTKRPTIVIDGPLLRRKKTFDAFAIGMGRPDLVPVLLEEMWEDVVKLSIYPKPFAGRL
jgi:hypothetical protein